MGISERFQYISAPMLDAAPPNRKSMQDLFGLLEGIDKNIYIHCAQGHGRAATVAAATLVIKNIAGSLDEAERIIKNKRPKIHIHKAQFVAAKEMLDYFGTFEFDEETSEYKIQEIPN